MNLPYMQFFPTDWLADCQVLSPAARGSWQTVLCKAWSPDCRGRLRHKPGFYARLFGASLDQTEEIIAELEECGVGEVIRHDDGTIELASRRMERDWESSVARHQALAEAGRRGGKASLKPGLSPAQAKRKPGLSEAQARLKPGSSKEQSSQAQAYQNPDTRVESVCAGAREIAAVVELWPKPSAPADCLAAVTESLAGGAALDDIERLTRECAASALQAPGGVGNRYVPFAKKFFEEEQWRSPEAFSGRWKDSAGPAANDTKNQPGRYGQ